MESARAPCHGELELADHFYQSKTESTSTRNNDATIYS